MNSTNDNSKETAQREIMKINNKTTILSATSIALGILSIYARIQEILPQYTFGLLVLGTLFISLGVIMNFTKIKEEENDEKESEKSKGVVLFASLVMGFFIFSQLFPAIIVS